jgi:transposase
VRRGERRRVDPRTPGGALMFGLAIPARVFLANDPVDMRKQYGGLWALAENKFRENPFGGALFVFTNKSRDRVKLLY